MIPKGTPVLLVDSDRLRRASLARALIYARFGVTALDVAWMLPATLRGHHGIVVVIASVEDLGIDSVREAISQASENLCLVVRTEAPTDVVEKLVLSARVRRFVVLPRELEASEVVGYVRQLLGGIPPRGGEG